MMRSVLAVIAGVVAAGIIIALVEMAGQQIYPLPEGVNPADPESVKAAMANIPTGGLLFVLLAWALGSFGGGWLAARIATQSRVLHGIIVGGIMLLAGIVNMAMIPHPLWFWVVGVLIFLPAAYLGARLGIPKTAG